MRPLIDDLRERIHHAGPISFAEFMEAALYDPGRGFFARTIPGERGHFVTSVHVSEVFAALLAVQARNTWVLTGRTDAFTVVDLGAADGALLGMMRAHLPDVPARFVAVERAAAARAAAAERGLEVAESIEQLEPFEGLLIANELFDNLPFHLLRARGRDAVEVLVGAATDGLIEVEASPSVPVARRTGEWTVSPACRSEIERIGERLRKGHALLIDYGWVGDEEPEPVRGYRAHRLVADLLREPGETDITGPVDFDALASAARTAGLQVWGPVVQREALIALGFREAVRAIRDRQMALERRSRWREAVAMFARRGQAPLLVDPAGLGSHKVLALGAGGIDPPLAVSG